jgi:hypothetical protein
LNHRGHFPAHPSPAAAIASSCEVTKRPSTEVVAGISHVRLGLVQCTTTGQDPRLTGSMTLYPSEDLRPDGAGDAWGEASIHTGDGAWFGPYSGTVDATGVEHLTGVMFGDGGQAGLRFTYTFELAPDGAWIGDWAGTYDPGWTTHHWTGVVEGSGDLAGLQYRYSTIGEWPRFVQVGVITSD